MKSHKIKPQHNNYHDQPSNVKLEHVFQDKHFNPQPHQVQIDIFKYMELSFKVNEIKIDQDQYLHTIYLQTFNTQNKDKTFYMTHGFGGSSLMYFPILKYLLKYGNIVLWQIRGMGFSKKLQKYNIQPQQQQSFFINPIQKMLKHYRHKQIYFISHSFGGYLTLLYILRYKSQHKNIKQLILLSPVGITPKQDDYKFKIRNFSDVMHSFGNAISWKFGLTYKSPFRCICACFKNKVFKSAVQGCGFNQQEKVLMKNLLISMVQMRDGSQNVFFDYFHPRVLPKTPIQPILTSPPAMPIKILFGGQQDWVDKKGAHRIQQKYPDKIDLKLVKQCGHNFPFFPSQLKRVLEQILFPQKQVNKNKLTILIQYQTEQDKANNKKSNSNQISISNSEHQQQKNSIQQQNSDDSFKKTLHQPLQPIKQSTRKGQKINISKKQT